ncbi:PD-(D/E)XK nuclease family protein [Bacillus salipaludis]|uniref:PD-(D/E)XK nuclease family protein n=1 Tax=Bacillus salipaludis TaxID=2547811 RepID=A0AA90TWE5_9BACI|nr:PD-(D/E)XK nuclease family protein [Bacillus salipaludis]MDQ6600688.1 PD-(D/E)XK nuclease family protein [Bacillus salipaludis]
MMIMMPGGNIPSPITLSPLKRISASRFFDMQLCSYREVLVSNGLEKLLPSSPNKFFGLAAHSFLQKVGSGLINEPDDFENGWLTTVSEVEQLLLLSEREKHLIPLSKTVKQFEVRKRVLFNKASSLIVNRRTECKSASNLFHGIESWFQTADGVVGGYLDRVLLTESGYEIIDYKTGAIIDKYTMDIKDAYKYQLFLYAALFYENLNEWPSALKIQGINGEEFCINYKKDECVRILNQAREMFHRVNELITRFNEQTELQKHLAQPVPENCCYCSVRPLCNAYWEAKEKYPQLKWNNDIRGQFKSLSILGNGTYLLKIKSGVKTYKIRGLKPDRHRILEGSFLSIYNLSSDKSENCFSENILTTIYTN